MGPGAKMLLPFGGALLLALAIAAPAAADTSFPIRLADPEELTVVDNCPQGRYVVGFNARTGQTGLDAVQIMCGELGAVGTGNVGPARGGSTRDGDGSRCGIGGVAVRNFNVFRNADPRQVRAVTFACALPFRNVFLDGEREVNLTRSIGLGVAGEADRRDKQECPMGELARGFTINYGPRIISMAMNCERVPAPVAATTPQSAPAASTTARPINAPMAFQGGWNTLTSLNSRFTLILIVENPAAAGFGMAMTVKGQIANIDGYRDRAGWLQGTVPPNSGIVQFSYAVPGTRLGGTGVLTLHADDTIAATGRNSDGTEFTWNGTRAK